MEAELEKIRRRHEAEKAAYVEQLLAKRELLVKKAARSARHALRIATRAACHAGWAEALAGGGISWLWVSYGHWLGFPPPADPAASSERGSAQTPNIRLLANLAAGAAAGP